MATYPAETITLRSRPFQESARLLDLFSHTHGRIEAVARGIGKPRSKLTPCTGVFTHCDLVLATGRTMHTVTQCQVRESFAPLRGDLRRTAHAAYLTELVCKSTAPLAPNPSLFELLLGALHELAQGADAELLIRAFELRWLGLIGLAPSLAQCASCGVPLEAPGGSGDPGGLYAASAGGLLCGDCARSLPVLPVCGGTRRALTLLASAEPSFLRRVRLDDRIRAELRRVLRAHIDYHLDLQLNSLKFLRSLEGVEAS